MAVRLPTATRNAMVAAAADRADLGSANAQGRLRIYSGAQPASANSPASGDLLAEVNLANPAFASEANGTALLAGVPISTVGLPAAAGGTAAGWFRIVDRDLNTVVDGTVGTSNAQLIVNTTTITENVTFEIISGSFTVPSGE